jgi:hypothetical protein
VWLWLRHLHGTGTGTTAAADRRSSRSDRQQQRLGGRRCLGQSRATGQTRHRGNESHLTPHGGSKLAKFNSYNAASGSQTRVYRTAGFAVASSYTTVSLKFWMYHDTGYSTSTTGPGADLERQTYERRHGHFATRLDRWAATIDLSA